MAAQPKVMLVYPLPDPLVEEELRAQAEVIVPVSDDPAMLVSAIADAEAVIVRGPCRFTAELIAAAPHLRVIGAQGSGTDNIDVAAASVRGIPVIHGAGIAPRAVAEYVLGAMVALHRGFGVAHDLLASSSVDWTQRLSRLQGTELADTTLGVVGYGHIGRVLAAKARAGFDVDVLAFDPYADDASDEDGVERVGTLDELLERSLTVSLHIPLTIETRGMIGHRELALVGPEGVLVDAARGGVVDEDALVQALDTGAIKGAALDVFDPEPPSRAQLNRLVGRPNLIVTPHIAGVTDRGLRDLSRNVVDNVLAVLSGAQPSHAVNAAALGYAVRR